MKHLFSILFFLSCATAFAQLQRNYTSYTVDNGLAQNTVWDAFQDYKGYMWFGTADGVNRFDGYKMKHYKYQKGDSSSLLGNSVFKFYEDSEKTLWISHDKGLSRYNRAKDCFVNIAEDNSIRPNGDRYTTVLSEDKKGRIWCISGYNELVGFDKKTLSRTTTNQFSHSQYPVSSIRTCIQSGKYIIGYLNDSSTTWFRLNTETDQSEIINGPKEFSGYFMLYNDSTVCAFSKGCFHLYNINKNTFSSKPINGSIMPTEKGAATSLAWWQGKIYLGNNTGLFVFNPVTCEFEEHILSFNKTERISFFYVQFLRVDHSGNLWICTNGAGVKCLSPYQNKFKHYASSESRNSLVKSITTDSEGNIYTGLYGQGLIWYTPNGEAKQYKFGKSVLDLTHVLGLSTLGKQVIMVNDREIKLFNPKSQTITSKATLYNAKSHKQHGQEAPHIAYPFFRKHNGRLYTCCDLSFWEIKPDGTPKELFEVANRDTFITTFDIINDSNWMIGTTKRLYQYNPIVKKWKGLDVYQNVKSICYSKQANQIWVGGNSGLYRLTANGNVLQEYRITDGLPDDFIYGILEDKYGRVWMSHNKGMSVYFPRTQTFKHYSVKDGLQSNEFNTGAYYKDEKGLMYFGGVNGINVIDPDKILENKNVPQIGINDILVDDLPYPFDTAFNEIKTLNLSYLQNTLSFDFSALEYSQPQDNIYRYKMEGYDNNWIESGTKHFIRYANLPPGSYTLKITAANGDGLWNAVPREIRITVTPPYWQTGWFYALIITLSIGAFIGTIFFIISLQRSKLKRDLDIQQQLEQERIRISRDLHDNVGAQLSYLITNVEWMLQHPDQLTEEDERHRLQEMSEAGRNAILTLRQTIWAISHSSLTLEDFADRFKQFALKMIVFNKQIHLQFKETIEINSTLSPAVALHLFRICQEAFNNCLKHSQAQHITITFYSNPQATFGYRIEDDGVGFNWEEAKRKGHYGLLNMQARAMEAHANLSIDSAPGKGTRVAIIFTS